MADVEWPAANGDSNAKASPQSSPRANSELKTARKREREVSLEPVATPASSTGAAVPAKNKRRLDATEEEDTRSSSSSSTRSGSRSPPRRQSGGAAAAAAELSASPRGEMKIKVRQISQGVEDLNWRTKSAEGIVNIKTPNNEVDDDPMQAAVDISPPAPSSPLKTELLLDSDPESGEREKSLKRKFLERGTSQGPPENGDAGKSGAEKRARDDPTADDNPRENKRPTPPPSEAPKRPREDADKDDNPRVSKRPSPPPEAEKKKTSAVSSGGFMAYASNVSPFASVKGQNLFSKSSSSSASSSKAASPPSTPVKSPFAGTTPPPAVPVATPAKLTGFEAFASSASPFASVPKSSTPAFGAGSKIGGNAPPSAGRKSPFTPATLNAFSAYTGQGAQGFAVPAAKRSWADSSAPSGDQQEKNSLSGDALSKNEPKKSFGERLRETRAEDDAQQEEDYEPKLNLTEKEVTTGEEDEHTISQVRGKLYTLAGGAAWKERGTGVLRLNVRASDGGGPRLVMRKDAVYTLLLNVTLFKGMKVELAQDPRYVRFSAIEDGSTVHYNLRLANAKIASEFLEEVHANIPSDDEPV